MNILRRLVLSVIVWLVAAIVVYLLGLLIASFTPAGMVQAGHVLQDNCGLIGLVCGLVYFFFGSSWPTRAV